MPSELEFTGERFVPGIAGEIAHEHWHRYAFARPLCADRRVLDVSCGEGYGSALLAGVATSVIGVDIAAQAVAHARNAYTGRANLRFVQGSAVALPLADASVDVAVSFETIEHLPAVDQPRMLAELARVLGTEGVLVLSAPNPVEYSQARNHRNPFHLHEPSRDELDAMLAGAFPARRWYRQRRYFGSALWDEAPASSRFDAWTGDASRVAAAQPPAAMYFVVVAARTPAALPAGGPALSLFSDLGESELARVDARAADVLRLDALLADRDVALDRQAAHVRHLEEIAAFRERVVVERDAQLADLNAAREALVAQRDALAVERDALARARDAAAAERAAALGERDDALSALASAKLAQAALSDEADRLGRAIAAQERIIAYRQSARWWFMMPWLRMRLWWQRVRGG
jgi:SAM-dependent methyltransferase